MLQQQKIRKKKPRGWLLYLCDQRNSGLIARSFQTSLTLTLKNYEKQNCVCPGKPSTLQLNMQTSHLIKGRCPRIRSKKNRKKGPRLISLDPHPSRSASGVHPSRHKEMAFTARTAALGEADAQLAQQLEEWSRLAAVG